MPLFPRFVAPSVQAAGQSARPAEREARAGLTLTQVQAVTAFVVLLHGLAVVGLLHAQVDNVRPVEGVPVVVELIAPIMPRTQAVPTPSVAPAVPVRAKPALVSAARDLPAAFEAPAPAVSPESRSELVQAPPAPAAVASPQAATAEAAVAATPPPPLNIPASAVQYLQAPVLEYPRLSRRAGESGRVTVRVFIDEAGLPRFVQVSQSCGFDRLDQAALAAVRQARFKPYTQNGRPAAGWAFIPLTFDLEQ